jgi:hypothetical protein
LVDFKQRTTVNINNLVIFFKKTGYLKVNSDFRLQQLPENDVREARQESLGGVGDLLLRCWQSRVSGRLAAASSSFARTRLVGMHILPSVFHARAGVVKMPATAPM